MKKKDQFDPHGNSGDSASRRDIADMSVDDLLNVLSGGKSSAADAPAAPEPYTPPAEETPSYEPQYESYAPAGEPVYDSTPVDYAASFDEYDLPDEEPVSEADYISANYPEPDEPAPPPVVSMYDDPSGREEEPEAPAVQEKPLSRKLKKADKKPAAEEVPVAEDKKSFLRRILDEDPDELLNTRREDPEKGGTQSGGNIRRTLYAAAGFIFSVLACIGLVSLIVTGSRFFGSSSSGTTGKKAMEKVIYPAVIMDIPSFSKPSELSSNQIITAAIWSLVMDKDAVNKYERTFDVITVPAVDVESYAAKLFGSELPAFEHGNAGPSEARFYYSEENKSYNIPIRPVTFTYSPRIKSVSRSGNEYTLEVDYMDELPEWVGEVSSKSVRYVLVSTNDGYQIKSMAVLSQADSMV